MYTRIKENKLNYIVINLSLLLSSILVLLEDKDSLPEIEIIVLESLLLDLAPYPLLIIGAFILRVREVYSLIILPLYLITSASLDFITTLNFKALINLDFRAGFRATL